MKAHPLLLLVACLVLWGADDSLGCPWSPFGGRTPSHHQEVFPVSLRLREQLYRRIRTAMATTASVCRRESELTVEGCRIWGEVGREQRSTNTLYGLMSLQL